MKKLMKAALSLVLCAVTAFAAAGYQGAAQEEAPSSGTGRLKVTDGQLTDESGHPVQLRGVSTHGIKWYPAYINAGAFRYVKERGGNVVRIAMYTDTESGYLVDPDGNVTLVRQAIEDAIAEDLYVIVDWHILTDGNPMVHLNEAITFFDAIASLYGDEPRILYEICNEPNGCSWQNIIDYAYAIQNVIRQYAPNAVMIVGTPDYSSNLAYAMTDPFYGENFLYAYHYYAGEAGSYEMLKKAVEEGLPVFVTEWGIGAGGAERAEDFADYMNKEGISWCAWSLSNKDEAYSLLKPDSYRIARFEDSDLSEAGRLIFDWMAAD